MRIGIHQPNFLPWMGYFYKIALSDTFVFLDNVEFTKKSFTKRVKIHQAQDELLEQYLTVPLQKHSDFTLINELTISVEQDWQKKIRNRLYETYHKAPYYFQVELIIEKFFSKPLTNTTFSDFTIEIIEYIATSLRLKTKFQKASAININQWSDDINLNLVKTLEGNVYVSGKGGKKYQDEALFSKHRIELVYSDYKTHFSKLDIPENFFNKSIISYLAYFDTDSILKLLQPPY